MFESSLVSTMSRKWKVKHHWLEKEMKSCGYFRQLLQTGMALISTYWWLLNQKYPRLHSSYSLVECCSIQKMARTFPPLKLHPGSHILYPLVPRYDRLEHDYCVDPNCYQMPVGYWHSSRLWKLDTQSVHPSMSGLCVLVMSEYECSNLHVSREL